MASSQNIYVLSQGEAVLSVIDPTLDKVTTKIPIKGKAFSKPSIAGAKGRIKTL